MRLLPEFCWPGFDYHPVTEDGVSSKHSRKPYQQCPQIFGLLACVAALLSIGFYAGRTTVARGQDDISGYLAPYGDTQEIWHNNLTFSSYPSPASEAAWASLIPVGRGFVFNPSLSATNDSLAVFHQLHCLHGLRVAYYGMKHQLEVTNEGASPDPYIMEKAEEVNLGHIRHCFDYLRRAIMCAADTNLEPLGPKTEATNGWGSSRTCRDFERVKKYAEVWKSTTHVGISK